MSGHVVGHRARRSRLADVRATPGMAITLPEVLALLDPDRAQDLLFKRVLEGGLLTSLSPHERSSLANVTGHVAESLVESMFVDAGFVPIWQFERGGVGVDLVVLPPQLDSVVVIEVKGTLRPGH